MNEQSQSSVLVNLVQIGMELAQHRFGGGGGERSSGDVAARHRLHLAPALLHPPLFGALLDGVDELLGGALLLAHDPRVAEHDELRGGGKKLNYHDPEMSRMLFPKTYKMFNKTRE